MPTMSRRTATWGCGLPAIALRPLSSILLPMKRPIHKQRTGSASVRAGLKAICRPTWSICAIPGDICAQGICANSITYEEANPQTKNWIRQRSRWIKGYMQTYLVYMRHPWRYLRPGHLREFISLQLVIGSKTAILFLNPLLWLLFASYFVFRPVIGHTIQAIYPKPLLYLSVVSLVF